MVLGLCLFGLAFNIYNFSTFYDEFPKNTSTEYFFYVFIRYINILAFFAVVILVLDVCRSFGVDKVENLIFNIGVCVAAYAVYVYLAQIFGLPELLPRNRMGTGGGEQSVVYTYAFHRASGSFREPSHLAEWLIVPFVLAFTRNGLNSRLGATLIGVVILLTGSLTGIVSLVAAFAVAVIVFFVLYLLRSDVNLDHSSVMRLTVKLSLFCFILVIVVNWILDGLLLDVIDSRLLVVLSDGIGASNRDYTYEYFAAKNLLSLAGMGLGNPQVELANFFGIDEVASLLNLYANMLLSSGLFGFLFLILMLIYPLGLLVAQRAVNNKRGALFVLFVGYFAWLIAFFVHSEELSVMFATCFGLIVARLRGLTLMQRTKISSSSPESRFLYGPRA
jgi:hypothetical protein